MRRSFETSEPIPPEKENPMPLPQNVIPNFRLNPVNFLTHNHLIVAGASEARAYRFKVTDRNFNPQPTSSAFRIQKTLPTDMTNDTFAAINVVMYPSNGPMNWQLLPDTGPPDLMVTGQLTACSFAIMVDPLGLKVTHLQPTGESGDALKTRLIEYGLKNQIAMTVLGAPDYDAANNGAATVIGVRNGTRWSIYAQKFTRATANVSGAELIYGSHIRQP